MIELEYTVDWIKKHLYLLPVFLYLPAFFNFFSGDDWFHLRISNINSISRFFNFFSFSHTAQSATFYRPLPTQVFFFVFQKLFGLNAWPYYLFVLVCFGFSLWLVYKFALSQFKDNSKAQITTVLYGLSVSNFTRVYFLSAFQEISLVIFSILCLLSFEKSKTKSLIYFIFALLSKETAIVLPVLLLIFNFKSIKKNIVSLLPVILTSVLYLFLRLKVFGVAEGDSYVWNYSLSKAGNTLMWYILWSFGAPELLVDYIGSGFRPIARFYTDYPYWWQTIFIFLFGTVISAGVLVLNKIKKIDIQLIKYFSIFLVFLAPVIFLPQHKFALELGLPLFGFSLAISWLLPVKRSIIKTIFFVFFICLNISMNYLTYTRHYSVNRSEISLSVAKYLDINFQKYPYGQYFEFVNDLGNYGSEWGQSKQLSQTLSGSDFFQVYYKDDKIKVYYQDIIEERPSGKNPIYLSSRKFIH